MRVLDTNLPGVLIFEPDTHADERGVFLESFNAREFAAATAMPMPFVQDNHSRSLAGVVRGLHYQIRRPQGKLVRVIAGAIFDVAVDIRRHSPYFGHWTGILLSAENRLQTWIPPGFAHGFAVVGEGAEVLYKTTDYYSPADSRAILWNDPAIGIAWPLIDAPMLSVKDSSACLLADAEVFDVGIDFPHKPQA